MNFAPYRRAHPERFRDADREIPKARPGSILLKGFPEGRMPASSVVLREVRRFVAAARPQSATDCELLGRFVAARDGPAFAELVRRHGPMVLGLCRRVLAHAADADDAFQATFLI